MGDKKADVHNIQLKYHKYNGNPGDNAFRKPKGGNRVIFDANPIEVQIAENVCTKPCSIKTKLQKAINIDTNNNNNNANIERIHSAPPIRTQTNAVLSQNECLQKQGNQQNDVDNACYFEKKSVNRPQQFHRKQQLGRDDNPRAEKADNNHRYNIITGTLY